MKRSRRRSTRRTSDVSSRDKFLILTEPVQLRLLGYDLMFNEKMTVQDREDVLTSWAVAYGSLGTSYRDFSNLTLIQHKVYMEELGEKLETWFYDKYLLDDVSGLTEDECDNLQGRWLNWQDLVELILTADYFSLLYRFIEQVVGDSREIESIKVIRRKVIVEYV